jgi:predicted nucleotidyltransferase
MKPIKPTQFRRLLELLSQTGVEFIVVGGVAAAALGTARVTFDLDVVYRRTPQNLDRLVAALKPLHPYPRGAPPGLPFVWDRRTMEFGINFTLDTSLGLIDILGEITGGGRFDDLLPHTLRLEVFGVSCLCIDLETLIRVKRAAGRPKDFEAIAELETLREEKARLEGGER